MSVYDDLSLSRPAAEDSGPTRSLARMATLIDLYSAGSGRTSEEAMVDMIVDLLHVADMLEGSSALTVLDLAEMHYEDELEA